MAAARPRTALAVIHYPVFSGPHNQALRLAAPLRERGWRTVVVLPKGADATADRLGHAGLPVHLVDLGRLRGGIGPRAQGRFLRETPADIRRLARVARDECADVVQVHGLAHPQAAVAGRRLGAGVVWQLLDTRAPPALRWALGPWVVALSDVVMTTGVSIADEHPVVRRRIRPIVPYFPPVDVARFSPDPQDRRRVRDELGIAPDATVVGTIGNVNPQKGLEYLVEAAGLLEKRGRRATYLLVGPRHETHLDYARQLDAAWRRSGIPAERIVTVEGRHDVERFHRALDVHLVTAVPRSEGTTTAALEALACGVPVVSTDVGGQREVIDDTVGALVPACDPPRLAAAVERLLADPALLARRGRAARRRAVERFDAGISADVHASAYALALQRRRMRR